MRLIDVVTGAAFGWAMVWFWPKSWWARKPGTDPNVTPSCGCIGCDFKLKRQRSHLGHYHMMNGDIINCTRNF